jgi:hypothetical protein
MQICWQWVPFKQQNYLCPFFFLKHVLTKFTFKTHLTRDQNFLCPVSFLKGEIYHSKHIHRLVKYAEENLVVWNGAGNTHRSDIVPGCFALHATWRAWPAKPLGNTTGRGTSHPCVSRLELWDNKSNTIHKDLKNVTKDHDRVRGGGGGGGPPLAKIKLK